MRYNYRISASAAEEIEHEIKYSAENWGRQHAKAYRKGLIDIVERIASSPFAERKEIGEGYRIARYKGNYIVYSVNNIDKYVEIIAFPSIYRMLDKPI